MDRLGFLTVSEASEALNRFADALRNAQNYKPDPLKVEQIKRITSSDSILIYQIETKTPFTYDEAIQLLLHGVKLEDLF